MFHLTRRERVFVVCVLLAFLTGLAVQHYRGLPETGATGADITHAKR